MKNLAVFMHGLFYIGDPPRHLPNAGVIMANQKCQMMNSGLWHAAQEIHIGINGGEESKPVAANIFPDKAQFQFHGLASQAENLTIVMLEKWLETHPDWYVLYIHAKSCTHEPPVAPSRTLWRECMMRNLVDRWERCVADLDSGYESVGCHWMVPPATPPEQFIWAGNFWWAKSDFLRTLPSIYKRARITQSGIGHADSRYEAEVWIGNGPRPPVVKDYHPGWNPSKWAECANT